MGTANKIPNLFTAKPLFGLDIGRSSLKIVQLSHQATKIKKNDKHKGARYPLPHVISYGSTDFDPAAIEDGVVVQPELIAQAAKQLFEKRLIGDVTSRRVALTIPSYRSFTRSIQLPLMDDHDMEEAVRLEAEQYIPVPLDDLYLDYTLLSKDKNGLEVLAVAVPRNIVDSYLELCAIIGLEPVLIETSSSSVARLFSHDDQSDVPTIIIDFGSVSSDISIYDGGLVTSGTVEGGGADFTKAIQEGLSVTSAEAGIIKTKYGLSRSKRQSEIQDALDPVLQKIIKEIKRLVRYHSERYGADRPITQVITLGGGANMPGLSEYFTSSLRLAVRSCDPWLYVDYQRLQPPSAADRTMYATAIGLALAPETEVFKND